MGQTGASSAVAVRTLRQGRWLEREDRVAVEEPLEIRVEGRSIAVTMRTPGDDVELAAGFCLTEGIVGDIADIERITPCRTTLEHEGNVVLVRLAPHALAAAQAPLEVAARAPYISSSCGVCGKQSIERVRLACRPTQAKFQVAASLLLTLPERLREAQATFELTGGLHAAGLFTPTGRLVALREDVGRHNAVDKAIGQAALDQQESGAAGATHAAEPLMLVVSGRAGFEIVQKAAMAGVALLAAVGAPSSLAVELARDMGVTLAGFVKPGSMNVYADAMGRVAE